MKYHQTTGKITTDIDVLIGQGYAGQGKGKNNPKMQNVVNVGPLPRGKYFIGIPYDSEHTGPFTIPLKPFDTNKMYGRSDFKIHGDSISNPGTASYGCIIMSRKTREAINNCTDKILEVLI
jgi:hypothetical protein